MGTELFCRFPYRSSELAVSRGPGETQKDTWEARFCAQAPREEGALGSERPGAGEGQRASGAQLLRTKLGAERRKCGLRGRCGHNTTTELKIWAAILGWVVLYSVGHDLIVSQFRGYTYLKEVTTVTWALLD